MNLLAVDTETTGLNPYDHRVRPTVASIASSWDTYKHGKVFRLEEDDCTELERLLADPYITKVFFNAKFDIGMLRKVGYTIRGKVADTSMMAKMVVPDAQDNTLKYLSRRFLGITYTEERELKQWIRKNKFDRSNGYADIPDHILFPYAIKDAVATLELFRFLQEGMDVYKLWSHLGFETKLLPIVMEMERHGIRVLFDQLEKLRSEGEAELEECRAKLFEMVGREFNPDSSPQVRDILFKGRKSRRLTRTGKESTKYEALIELGTPLALEIVRYRKLKRAVGNYLKNIGEAVGEDHKFRVSFNQFGARTGRFSSSGYDVKGQLQNIPRGSDTSGPLGKIRSVFGASPGRLLALIDYEQIEMRLCAHFTGDPAMIKAIREGADLHGETCRKTFGLTPDDPTWKTYRFLAKSLNFAVIYGVGAKTFADTILKQSDGAVRITNEEAFNHIRKYKESHPYLMALFNEVNKEVAKTGGVVDGFGRHMPVDKRKPYVGVNYKIQGTAAGIIKRQMFACHDYLKDKKTNMILQVHDELVFDVHQEDGKACIMELARLMEVPDDYSVPLTVSCAVGKNWLDKKELELCR